MARENDFQITVQELKTRLEQGDNLVLVDVREPFEYDICRLEGARLIPLGQLSLRVNELDPKQEIVLYCHAGIRSMRALVMLYQAGFDRIKNLTGGIDAWALEIDPHMPRY